MTALRPIAACLAMACTLLVVPAGGQALASPSMVERINTLRKSRGLPALRESHSLSRSSRSYAGNLARTDRFRHASRIRASSRFSRLGEILARTPGARPDRARTLAEWLASPSHRAVLLSRAFSWVGAGRARGYAPGGEAVVWAVQFGHR